MSGGNRCILPSLTLSKGKWHTWSEGSVSRCRDYRLGCTDKTLDTVPFHRLEPMTLVISYIKFSQLVENGISWCVEMLTWICQASRLHLCAAGNER